MSHETELQRAAETIASADALLIAAGAGMGVDSGLSDFRGDRSFWRAYPPYERLGLNFVALANPRWFATDPELAWGFYGHRLNLYRTTPPHAGFQLLRGWAKRLRHGAFIFTSNVDGHFQRAGFDPDRITEVHGAINWLQCLHGCGIRPFGADAAAAPPITVDETSMRAWPPLPACLNCGGLARPNILMFGDGDWDNGRTADQQVRLRAWLSGVGGGKLVVIECGAGTAVPTVRHFCERVAVASGGTLVRINLREPAVPPGQVSLSMGALKALQAIDERLAVAGRWVSSRTQG